MRVLSSILLFLISFSLSAKQYNLSSDSFSATLDIGAENFVEQPYFNLDITTAKNIKVELPSDFEEKFYIEGFEKIPQDESIKHRWLLIIKEPESFTLGAIKLSKGEEILSFENLEFRGKGEATEPTLHDIFLEEDSKAKYYLILILTLLTSVVFCIKKKKAEVKTLLLNLSDLDEAKSAREFSEKFFRHLNKILKLKYAYPTRAKSAEEISIFLSKAGFESLADFTKDSDKFMYAKDTDTIAVETMRSLKLDLERLWDSK